MKKAIALILLMGLVFCSTAFATSYELDETKTFAEYLDDEGHEYAYGGVLDEGEYLIVTIEEDNGEVTIYVVFDEDGNIVSLFVLDVTDRFKSSKLDEAREICNELNDLYRYVRFYTKDSDSKYKVVAQFDLYVYEEDMCEIIWEGCKRTAMIVDGARDTFEDNGF